MTQVKLWQIKSQNSNSIIFSDSDGNLTTLAQGGVNQVLVIGENGVPQWVDNEALSAAYSAKDDATNALAAAKAYTQAQITALVNGAPVALDTLNELAQKLAGDETAINALIAQMDGKASKTEVNTLVAQTKTDTLSAAATDAQTKANSAQSGAIQFSVNYADQKASSTLSAAFADASTKASNAQGQAISAAYQYTNGQFSQLRSDIPNTFWVEGKAMACFVASSSSLDVNQMEDTGIIVLDKMGEVTGAKIEGVEDSFKSKLLFINGVAINSEDWTADYKDVKDRTSYVLSFSSSLTGHFFDGSENTVMLLTEYKSYNPISFR